MAELVVGMMLLLYSKLSQAKLYWDWLPFTMYVCTVSYQVHLLNTQQARQRGWTGKRGSWQEIYLFSTPIIVAIISFSVQHIAQFIHHFLCYLDSLRHALDILEVKEVDDI